MSKRVGLRLVAYARWLRGLHLVLKLEQEEGEGKTRLAQAVISLKEASATTPGDPIGFAAALVAGGRYVGTLKGSVAVTRSQ